MKPLISVIVPVYNVESFLNRCVTSIVNQTYKNLEIILVNDGSTDSSSLICDEWVKRDSRVQVIHNKNMGVSAARNAGLNAATGEFIGFVDSDDYIADDMYAFLYGLIEEYQADIARCSYYFNYVDQNRIEPSECCEEVCILDNKEEQLNDLHRGGHKTAVIWNKLYKSSIIKNVRFNTEFVVAEDVLFDYEAYRNAERIVYHDLPKYYYSIHEEQCNRRYDFNYQAFRALDYLTTPECAILLFYKLFVFSCMAIRDATNNKDIAMFTTVRNVVIKKFWHILKSVSVKRDFKNVLKLFSIVCLPHIYRSLIKAGL